ncbi:MAG: methyltransferase domain-containing protein [Gammaproteobacteria bacterium]
MFGIPKLNYDAGNKTRFGMSRVDQSRERDAIRKEYARLAPVYDTRWSLYIEATTNATLARLSAHRTARILDVGCGTGILLQGLAQKFPQATLFGIDPVPEMLAVARTCVSPSTELHEAWVEELPFEDNTFDVVVSCNMFHYVQQPVSALVEMSRVLRPGGELLITDWCDDYLTCRIFAWCLRLFSPVHMKVYGRWECLRLLKEAGYPQAHLERYKINWLWGLMTARMTKHTGHL